MLSRRAPSSRLPLPGRRSRGAFALLALTSILGLATSPPARGEEGRVERLLRQVRERRLAPHEPGSRGAVDLAALDVAATVPGAIEERYEVNAQFRGIVKKGFDELGHMIVRHYPLDASHFRIVLEAELHSPDSPEVRRFSADLKYSLDEAGRIQPLEAESNFSEGAEKHREKILQNAPFIYLMRHRPYVDGRGAELSFLVGDAPRRIRYAPTQLHVEATVLSADRWLGKFFINRKDGGEPPYEYDKFRVKGGGDTVISFVCAARRSIEGGGPTTLTR